MKATIYYTLPGGSGYMSHWYYNNETYSDMSNELISKAPSDIIVITSITFETITY